MKKFAFIVIINSLVYNNIPNIESTNQNCRRPLTLFSFITATARDGSQVTEKRLQDVSEVLKDNLTKGTALKCKEKNGQYTMYYCSIIIICNM